MGEAAVAEATEFTIGTRASCADGYCGEVSRLIIDPDEGTVTHLVITPHHHRVSGRLVPLDLVDTAGGDIRLRCTLAEFGQLEHAAERELVTGMEGLDGGLIGLEYGTQPGSPRAVVEDVTPVGEIDVAPGDRVHAVDGEIGRVQGFIVNPATHRATHVLLQEGHLWDRKEVAIPVSAITGFDGGIWLSLTKHQIADLPPVD
jgi:hypothetical protein